MEEKKPLTLGDIKRIPVKYIVATLLPLLLIALFVWNQDRQAREDQEFHEYWCTTTFAQDDPECY